MLAKSCSDALVNKTKSTDLELNDDINSHKSKAARTLQAENSSGDNSDAVKNALPNILNQTAGQQT